MNNEPLGSVATQPSSPLEALLAEVLACEEVNLVVRNGRATAEIRGVARLRIGAEWLTINLSDRTDHVHVQRDSLAQAELLKVAGRNKAVRFLGEDGQAVLTCYLPGTGEERPDFSAARQAAFSQNEAKVRDASWCRVLETKS